MEKSFWTLSQRRNLEEALHRSRAIAMAKGHDWDIADVMTVLEQEGFFKLNSFK